MSDPKSTTAQKAEAFRTLHAAPGSFVIANAWDAGSAKLLRGLGFSALATSSGAEAGVLGRVDGRVTRDEALAHARAIADAVDLPVSADLENCFADRPEEAAKTIAMAAQSRSTRPPLPQSASRGPVAPPPPPGVR
jgi:2-methylisocitrate lyase-like PEP mutase family enzyme